MRTWAVFRRGAVSVTVRNVRRDERAARSKTRGARRPGIDVTSRGPLNIYRRARLVCTPVPPRLNLNTVPFVPPLVRFPLREQRFFLASRDYL